jgi:uncharacterized membrane protein
MKDLVDFIKTAAIGGLIVIIPLTVILLVLAQLLSVVVEVTSLAAEYLPFDSVASNTVVLLFAVGGIVGICFLTGLLLRTRIGDSAKNWFEGWISERIPMYGLLRNLTQRLVGIEGTEMAPAEINLYGTASRVIGFIVEELPDNRYAVFVPQAPVATMGQIYVLPKANVQRLDASMAEAANAITQWGVGTELLYKKTVG